MKTKDKISTLPSFNYRGYDVYKGVSTCPDTGKVMYNFYQIIINASDKHRRHINGQGFQVAMSLMMEDIDELIELKCITPDEYSLFAVEYDYSGQLRIGQAFCNKFNLTDPILFYIENNAIPSPWDLIKAKYVKGV